MSEFYTEINQKNRDASDRYKNCKILRDKETNEVLLSTRDINKINLNNYDYYHTVNANEEFRLDLIADKYYNNPLLWWVLAQANDIYDPLSRPVSGDIIRIPSINTLYGNNGVLL